MSRFRSGSHFSRTTVFVLVRKLKTIIIFGKGLCSVRCACQLNILCADHEAALSPKTVYFHFANCDDDATHLQYVDWINLIHGFQSAQNGIWSTFEMDANNWIENFSNFRFEWFFHFSHATIFSLSLYVFLVLLSILAFDKRHQASFYSTALKTLISVSTVILLGLIVAYHALEVQVYVCSIRYVMELRARNVIVKMTLYSPPTLHWMFGASTLNCTVDNFVYSARLSAQHHC